MATTYTIGGGEHYSRPRVPYLFWSRTMHRRVMFSASCSYRATLGEDEEDVSKLFGFGEPRWWKVLVQGVKDLFSTGKVVGEWHHEQSARFGWCCNRLGEVWLFAYCYTNGNRQIKKLCRVEVGEVLDCTIKVADGLYVFTVVGPGFKTTGIAEVPRGKKGKAFGFGLFPYFGGDAAAPHTMQITIGK